MLEASVTLPKLGVRTETTIRVPDCLAYDASDRETFANRTITIAAQAACRQAGESAAAAWIKANPKAEGEERAKGIAKAAHEAMQEWARTKGKEFMVERRDVEAMKAKKAEKVIAAAADLDAGDAAKLLAMLAEKAGIKLPAKAAKGA